MKYEPTGQFIEIEGFSPTVLIEKKQTNKQTKKKHYILFELKCHIFRFDSYIQIIGRCSDLNYKLNGFSQKLFQHNKTDHLSKVSLSWIFESKVAKKHTKKLINVNFWDLSHWFTWIKAPMYLNELCLVHLKHSMSNLHLNYLRKHPQDQILTNG